MNFKKDCEFIRYLNSDNYKRGEFPESTLVPHVSGNSFFKESACHLGYDGFSTALPVLTAVIALTEGTVIEFGGGNSSTPVLGALTKALGRRFITFESDPLWMKAVRHSVPFNREVYSYDSYNVECALERMCKFIKGDKLGAVFIDGDAPYNHRGELLKKLPEYYKCNYVVSHDYDPENDTSNFLNSLSSYTANFIYNSYYPYTLVSVNNENDIEKLARLNIVKRLMVKR
jgi:hypothetical protein